MAGCKVKPDKGVNLFTSVLNKYGREAAWNIYKLTSSKEFENIFNKVGKDNENYPLLEEIINMPIVRYAIGEERIAKEIESHYDEKQYTPDNYNELLELAKIYNENPSNKNIILIVDGDTKGNIRIKALVKNEDNIKTFNEQYAANRLNQKLASQFKDIGVTVGNLTEAEVKAGRVGVVNFEVARGMATSFSNMIQIAKNIEGAKALSEEFSHLIISIFKDEIIMRRLQNSLKNEDALRAILGEEYDNYNTLYNGDLDIMSEEALGHLLQQNFLIAEDSNINNSLLERVKDYLKSKFKNYDELEIYKAIDEANSELYKMAKNLLSGELQINREMLNKVKKRSVALNALSDRIDKDIDILKKAQDTEVKRLHISPHSEQVFKNHQEYLISLLDVDSTKLADYTYAMGVYAKNILESLKELNEKLSNIDTKVPKEKFKILRSIRDHSISYSPFILNTLQEIRDARKDSDSTLIDFYTNIEVLNDEGETEIINLEEIINELSILNNLITEDYKNITFKNFIEYAKEFYGEDITINGVKMSLETLLKQEMTDISITDMWLDSMAHSSNTFAQLIDKIVKNAKTKAREESIEAFNEIDRLILKAQSLGMKDFEWMFEHDSEGNKTGYYIGRINYKKYNDAYAEFEASMLKKYGRNPIGTKKVEMNKERMKWYSENTEGDDFSPKESLYGNDAYNSLSETQKQFLEEYLDLKEKIDFKYPSNKVDRMKCIMKRKTGANRVLEVMKDPTSLFKNIKEAFKEDLKYMEDDDLIFGDGTTKGLTNFDGTEYMMIPSLYTGMFKDPNEITTDIFGALRAYTYSGILYSKMSDVVDPLEAGRFLLTDKVIKIRDSAGTKLKQEKINIAGKEVTNPIYKNNTNLEEKLRHYYSSQIYQRYIEDEGNILESNYSKSKFFKKLLEVSSFAKMGFNVIANIANVATGACLTNIEVASGEYFNKSELWEADKEYKNLLKEFLPQLGSTVKNSKLHLLNETFNIRQDYGSNAKRMKAVKLLEKIFGTSFAYLGQEAGDHWLYNRVAIATLKHTKVLVPKKTVNIPKVRGLEDAKKAVNQIIADSLNLNLTSDESFYTDKDEKYVRTTSAIQAQNGMERFDPDSPWAMPSTNIGTGVDEMVRDFFDGKIVFDGNRYSVNNDSLESLYPNVDEEQLQEFAKQLQEFKNKLDAKGLTIVPRDITISGLVNVNVGGDIKQMPIAGTLDLLAYDKEGNFHIFDMKTHRSGMNEKKKQKYSYQLSLYKKMLEEKYGLNVVSTNIIPIEVKYPAPKGFKSSQGFEGNAEYSVIDGTNQLNVNGELYKNASPKLEDYFAVNTKNFSVDYNLLTDQEKLLVKTSNKEIDLNDYIQTNLYDALQVVNAYSDNSKIKKMIIPEGTLMADTLTSVNIGEISEKIAAINHNLFGVYNEDDANAASRVVWGMCVQHMRRWFKPAINHRFEARRYDSRLKKEVEGYYRTLFSIAKDAYKGGYLLGALINNKNVNQEDLANFKRAKFELVQLLAFMAVSFLAPWDGEKKNSICLQMLELMVKRTYHELAGLTPTPMGVYEIVKTMQQPAIILSDIQNLSKMCMSLANPHNWYDTIDSGYYKGWTKAQKAVYDTRLGPIGPVHNIIRVFDEDLIGNSTRLYNN